MKFYFITLGVLLTVPVFGQKTVTYSYDAAGNRAARSAPKQPVAQAPQTTTYELLPSSLPERSIGLAQLAHSQKEPYRCLVVPDDPTQENKNGSRRERSRRKQVKRTK